MKKVILTLAFILSVVLFAGCSTDSLNDNNYPDYLRQGLYEETAYTMISLTNSNIGNIGDFEKQVKLVAYTMEKNSPFSVTFLYVGESGKICTLPEIQGECSYMNSYEYREELKNAITNEALEILEKLQMEPGNVVATILTWGPSIPDKTSLCDLNGDGVWDYLVDDYAFFGSSSENYPSITINESEVMMIPGEPSGSIIALNNLSGDEKLSDFIKLL